jgi:hypothetical protein
MVNVGMDPVALSPSDFQQREMSVISVLTILPKRPWTWVMATFLIRARAMRVTYAIPKLGQ